MINKLNTQNKITPKIPKFTNASNAGISTYQNLYPFPKIKSNQSLEIKFLIKLIEKNFTSLNNLKKKWQSFGWFVQEIEGHSITQIISALKKTNKYNKPNLIIANTKVRRKMY